ncbi:MAG TPA: hypothetical protein VM582_06425, partial [Candidatus Thermoplasmatota archaeon]|nr:hypothetical protein [Candidatus Thermoplasmatota archaeon]
AHEQPVERLFDFPLVDGKTWASGAARVVARAATVATPAGGREGFVMRFEDGELRGEWAYAPEVGFLTRFHLARGDRVLVDATLVAVGEGSPWVWYEPLASAYADGTASAVLQVPPEADAVAGNAGARGAALALLQPPAAPPWRLVGGESARSVPFVLPASPGAWLVATGSAADGEAYALPVAVRWVRS